MQSDWLRAFWPIVSIGVFAYKLFLSLNISNFNLFFLWKLSCDQTGHTHFWPHTPKKFLINFNLCKFVSTCKKPSINLFWRYGWLKNPAIWLAENILANISGTKIVPNMGFVQKHSKYKFPLYNKFSKN